LHQPAFCSSFCLQTRSPQAWEWPPLFAFQQGSHWRRWTLDFRRPVAPFYPLFCSAGAPPPGLFLKRRRQADSRLPFSPLGASLFCVNPGPGRITFGDWTAFSFLFREAIFLRAPLPILQALLEGVVVSSRPSNHQIEPGAG